MHVLRGLQDVPLGYVKRPEDGRADPNRNLGTGSVNTWVDDITIATGGGTPGTGVLGHCEMLKIVFGRLVAAGFTLKPSKSHLLHRYLEVLGYRITPEGIKPHEAKVAALRNMPDRLSGPKEVLRFMGMINFNRRFIFMLSDVAAPLYALLKQDDPRPWHERYTPECDTAYRTLKQALVENCMNSHPDLTDPSAEFVIMTDASGVAPL